MSGTCRARRALRRTASSLPLPKVAGASSPTLPSMAGASSSHGKANLWLVQKTRETPLQMGPPSSAGGRTHFTCRTSETLARGATVQCRPQLADVHAGHRSGDQVMRGVAGGGAPGRT